MMLSMGLVYLLLPQFSVFSSPLRFLGVPLFAWGLWLALSTKGYFKSTATPLAVMANPPRLHTDGSFRFTRNPMYLGIAAGLLGLALISGNYLNLAFPVLFWLLMDRAFVPKEEVNLQREFPQDYPAYRKRVRRWL